MAAEALLAALEREARAEAERLRARAQAEADRIVARAEAEVARRRALFQERLEVEGRERIGREVAGAAREARRRVLEARAALLDRVFTRAEVQLGGVAVEAYSDLLSELVDQTLRYLETGEAVLECRPDAAPLVRAAVGERPGVRIEEREDAPPGVLARSPDGRIVVDNTMPARLARARDDLAVVLAARLEGQ